MNRKSNPNTESSSAKQSTTCQTVYATDIKTEQVYHIDSQKRRPLFINPSLRITTEFVSMN